MIELAFEFHAMGGPNEIRLVGTDEHTLRDAAQSAIGEVRRIEYKYSRYQSQSIVSRINALAGTGTMVAVDTETAGLFDFASRLFEVSGGLFDISSGVLRRVWDFRNPVVPSARDVQALLPLIGWDKVHWCDSRIQLPSVGMEVDFGGFGKEYAADRASDALRLKGVMHGYINLGGDIRVVGPRSDLTHWQFGIRHPRQANALIRTVALGGGALTSSGDYERFFEIGGRRYCHVLDPRTGWPVSYWQSVSAVAPTCAGAGSLCTIAMLMGAMGLAFLEEQSVPYVAVTADEQLYCRSE